MARVTIIAHYVVYPILRLSTHLTTNSCCKFCASPTSSVTNIVAMETLTQTRHNIADNFTATLTNLYHDGPLPIPLSPRATYIEPLATMVAELHAVADTTYLPTYADP